jgi:hypothetical protein
LKYQRVALLGFRFNRQPLGSPKQSSAFFGEAVMAD